MHVLVSEEMTSGAAEHYTKTALQNTDNELDSRASKDYELWQAADNVCCSSGNTPLTSRSTVGNPETKDQII